MSLQDMIVPVLKKYGVKKASLFGSYARGDFDEQSDVDLLIEAPKGMGLQFITLKHELEDLVKKKIDLVTYNSLNKYLKPFVLNFEKPLI